MISKLARAEHQEHYLLSAEISALLANRLLQEGEYRFALHWAKWSLQVYEFCQKTDSAIYWQNFHQWLVIKLLLGEFIGVQESIVAKQDKIGEFSETSSWMLNNALMYLALYKGNFQYAAQIGEKLWASTSQRTHLVNLANLYVRALITINEEKGGRASSRKGDVFGTWARQYI